MYVPDLSNLWLSTDKNSKPFHQHLLVDSSLTIFKSVSDFSFNASQRGYITQVTNAVLESSKAAQIAFFVACVKYTRQKQNTCSMQSIFEFTADDGEKMCFNCPATKYFRPPLKTHRNNFTKWLFLCICKQTDDLPYLFDLLSILSSKLKSC